MLSNYHVILSYKENYEKSKCLHNVNNCLSYKKQRHKNPFYFYYCEEIKK